MTNENLNLDIDSLLDGTLDDLADAPEFKPFPIGAHKIVMKWETKQLDDSKEKGKKNTIVTLKMKAIETVETPAGSDEVCSPGQEENIGFFLVHHSSPKAMEIGQGAFKEIMKSLAAHYGAKSNRELMADSEGAEALVTTGLRADKTDKTKKYTKLEKLMIV
jgi:hypothetical protein